MPRPKPSSTPSPSSSASDANGVRYSLLDEKLLGVVDDADRREMVTLPGLLARLSQGTPTELTALLPHQRHALHSFLVQLAVLALARGGMEDLAHEESAWRSLLIGAAAEDDAGPEAFALVVNNLAKPAFLQPPVPEGSLAALQARHTRPTCELDVLVTARNFDVKMNRLNPSLAHWVCGLITLQTMQGVYGQGNYGVVRMNKGLGSRSCVTYTCSQEAAPRFLRDVRALLDARSSLNEPYGYGRGKRKSPLGLIWCAPWDGKTALHFADLDPAFIEICRRVRLTMSGEGTLVAYRGTSKLARVEAGESKGDTGDAWGPVAQRSGKLLTMPEGGFSYDRVQSLMFDPSWALGCCGKPQPGDSWWLGQVMVRGQGKTAGYHERWIQIPSLTEGDRKSLGVRSQKWVELAGLARRKVLKPAALAWIQGGPEKLDFEDTRVNPTLRDFDRRVDEAFFGLLFEYAHLSDAAAEEVFRDRLYQLARRALWSAINGLPVPATRRWRAGAKAYRAFYGTAAKHLGYKFPANAAEEEAIEDASAKELATGAQHVGDLPAAILTGAA